MVGIESAPRVTGSDRQILAEVKQAVARVMPGAAVVVYGSAARGERGPESDYDVLVLAPRRFTPGEELGVRSAVYEVELRRDVVISVNVETREHWDTPVMVGSPYRQNVECEGVLL